MTRLIVAFAPLSEVRKSRQPVAASIEIDAGARQLSHCAAQFGPGKSPIRSLFYRLFSIRIRRENRSARQATVGPSFFFFPACRRTTATIVGPERQLSGFRDRWRYSINILTVEIGAGRREGATASRRSWTCAAIEPSTDKISD
jgi:hypothetical protein